jgi:hypothetical protein
MLREIIGTSIIALVYLCLLVIIFAQTLYALWFYIIGRRISAKSRGLLRIALTTFCINAVIAYFLFRLAFDYFLSTK